MTTENQIQVSNTPNGPQVYVGGVRIHHWPLGATSAIIGALGLLFDDNKSRRGFYGSLAIAGTLAFLDDFSDFKKFVDNLGK